MAGLSLWTQDQTNDMSDSQNATCSGQEGIQSHGSRHDHWIGDFGQSLDSEGLQSEGLGSEGFGSENFRAEGGPDSCLNSDGANDQASDPQALADQTMAPVADLAENSLKTPSSVAAAPVFLPKTGFPMRGNLPVREPEWIKWWQDIGLYDAVRDRRSQQKAQTFVLHDGPPYANGTIHMGHGMNKILKDFAVRWHGKTCRVDFRPGWDCHGLPIETQIEKNLLQEGVHRRDLSVAEFRSRCRAFADHWVEVQKQGFTRLGILADWQKPYRTMDNDFTAGIVASFFQLLTDGYVYRGVRPVLWSASEQTALAEAEIDYQDVTSPAIYVRFPLVGDLQTGWQGASLVIWTTTPWSLPGNRAIAYQKDCRYGLYQIHSVQEGSFARVGERIVVALARFDDVAKATGIAQADLVEVFQGAALDCVQARHPWAQEDPAYDFSVPLLAGDFVTDEAGTGLVHIAPCHGMDDFILGQKHALEVAMPLSAEGIFEDTVPGLAGLCMNDCYQTVRQMLIGCGHLLGEHAYKHSYPHSWRSKKPLFYRATPQWFIALDGQMALRDRALACLNGVTFYPESAENRMKATLARRPDWCISRQRVWGVPIAVFVNKNTGEVLNDPLVNQRICQKISSQGADFWFTDQANQMLDGLYDPHEWVKGQDIIDVWFESGVTHQVVLAKSPGLWPADVYLEGSDQHRAWFQSSLLTACALTGQPPYKAIVTHGFCLDQKGRKMSKSLGNVIDPIEVVGQLGADVLRLWVAYEDYRHDVRVGKEILARAQDLYRRFRNTFRFLLGAVDGLSPQETLPLNDLGVLDRWALSRLAQVGAQVEKAYQTYDFRTVVDLLHQFCAMDLSSFYLNACKDVLYCEGEKSPRRASTRTAILHIFVHLVDLLAPIIPFTAEEAWGHFGRECAKVEDTGALLAQQVLPPMVAHLQTLGLLPQDLPAFWSVHLADGIILSKQRESWRWSDTVLIDKARQVRSAVTAVLEQARAGKAITDSLQAAPQVFLTPGFGGLSAEMLAEVCVTSAIDVHLVGSPDEMPCDAAISPVEAQEEGGSTQKEAVGVRMQMAIGHKCNRCWRVLPPAIVVPEPLCQRCAGLSAVPDCLD
jgi:isoleucyl-tRNA synthetase